MLLLQDPWSIDDSDPLPQRLAQILKLTAAQAEPLVLLPQADDGLPPASLDDLKQCIGQWAEQCQVFLAASAVTKAPSGKAAVYGVLADPEGTILLSQPKAGSEIPTPFAVANTVHGQLGLLCGDDVLSPGLTRALVFSGAELILNPSRELSDSDLSMRLAARRARAYENLAWVACAAPRSVRAEGLTIDLPGSALVADPWGRKVETLSHATFLDVAIDIEALRQRRQEPRTNFPAIVRAAVYADDLNSASPAARATMPESDIRYDTVLCQHVVHQAATPDQLVPNRQRNIDDALALIKTLAAGPNTRLAVLPEFFLTGPVSPLGDQLGHLAEQIGILIPGPETDQLARFARQHQVYLAAGSFEFDPEWPQRFFNSAYIIDDQGELILKYRKIHCADAMGFLPDTTPGSVFSSYVERYGYESLFPVVDTSLGRLAATICFDMNFPETYRALAARGAEIVIHPTSEPHNRGRTGWDIARQVRAFENQVYVLSCGHGGEHVGARPVPSSRARGYSKVVDFKGNIQVVADGPGRVALPAQIDLGALRRMRSRQPGPLSTDDPSHYAAAYSQPRGIPNDVWQNDPLSNPYRHGRQILQVIEQYNREGIYVPPGRST